MNTYRENGPAMGKVLRPPHEVLNFSDIAEPTRSPEFEQLVIEQMDMLYAVALKHTRNSADAADLKQNTVLKALRFHDKFEKGTYIKAWLLTILRNTYINEYRRKSRRPSTVELSGIEPARDTSPDPKVRYQPLERDSQKLMELLDDPVKRAIEALPPDFRDTVIMADIEEIPYKSIAKRMKCPLGTVMSRLFRGRRLLREKLRDYAHDCRSISDKTFWATPPITKPKRTRRRSTVREFQLAADN